MEVEIKGQFYEIRELSMREFFAIMEDKENSGQKLVKTAVMIQGEQIGDKALDLPFTTFQKLMNKVNELHGFNDKAKEVDDQGES